MSHKCHANKCEKNCQPEKLMCRDHWAQVPEYLKQEVFKYYTAGQCKDVNLIKIEWLRAARRSINHVAGIPTGKLPY